jgi:predicted RNA-binding protein with PUA-like domain
MAYWLLKSDPETYSFDDLVSDKATTWDGVRNPQARNYLAAMKAGDECLVYHSGEERAVVGMASVVKGGYPEPGARGAPWVCVDLEAGKRLPKPVDLQAMKKNAALSGMAILRQSRLSVSPVTAGEWKAVRRLGGLK